MRISGLASGMDVDKMVSDMMKPYKIKVDKAKQEKELVKWKQDSYREVIADLNKFRFTYLDGKGGSKNILNLKAGDVLGVKDIVGNSVTAKISSNKADEGEYTITVNKLAKSAKKVIDIAKDYKQSKDATLTIDLKNGKSPIKIDLVGSGSNADTLDTIANKIVKESKGEVTAKYSEVAGGFIIQNIKTGVESKLEINCTNKDGSVNNDFSKINKENSGENADIIIETPQGKKIIQQNDSSALQENQINIDGINLQLTHEGKTEFKVSKNTDEVYKKVKEFTDEYNKLVGKIYTKITEKKQYKYKPLTEEQKKEMSKEDINLWEEKAKQGILRDDTDIRDMLNSLRECFFGKKSGNFKVEGCNINFGDKIGITTSLDYTKPGQIVLDENKFKESLEKNPREIIDLFTKRADSDHLYTADTKERKLREERFNQEGVFNRLKDVFLDFTRTLSYGSKTKGRLIEKAGMKDEYGVYNEFNSTISKQLIKKEEAVKKLLDKNASMENKFYLKFAKLESILNSYNSQAGWLTSQFGGGQR